MDVPERRLPDHRTKDYVRAEMGFLRAMLSKTFQDLLPRPTVGRALPRPADFAFFAFFAFFA